MKTLVTLAFLATFFAAQIEAETIAATETPKHLRQTYIVIGEIRAGTPRNLGTLKMEEVPEEYQISIGTDSIYTHRDGNLTATSILINIDDAGTITTTMVGDDWQLLLVHETPTIVAMIHKSPGQSEPTYKVCISIANYIVRAADEKLSAGIEAHAMTSLQGWARVLDERASGE